MLIRALKPGLIAAFGTGLLVSAANAQQPPSSKRPAADPNEKVCEDIIPVGSRLATKRICATRQQWEDQKRLDRETTEKAQTQLCVVDPATKKC